jgi:hypothetical protein
MPQAPRNARTPSPVRGPRECPGAPERPRRIVPAPFPAKVARALFAELEASDAKAARDAGSSDSTGDAVRARGR